MYLRAVATGASRRKATSARRLRDILRAQIRSGVFPNSQLPSEAELMWEFHVGRNVVRAALAQLQQERLIARIQGAGTFIVMHKALHVLKHGGIATSIADPLAHLETTVTNQQQGWASGMVAVRLGVPQRTTCLVIDMITTVDRQPMIVGTSYVPDSPLQKRLCEVVAAGRWRGDWYEALRRSGLGSFERELALEAVVADELVAADIDIDVGDPVMFVERRLFGPDGTACEYGFAHCRGDRFSYVYRENSTAPGEDD